MTKDRIHAIWVAEVSIRCRWTKSVLFSFLSEEEVQIVAPPVRNWQVPAVRNSAVIVNLGGAEGVALGMALCVESGFRPIPVYNACPYATSPLPSLSLIGRAPQVSLAPVAVDTVPIMRALAGTSAALEAAALPSDAPPAFLIDEDRHGEWWMGLQSEMGWFDNRSFVTKSDFPSAQLLKERGLSTVILIQTKHNIQSDVLLVLLTWQREGIAIARQKPWVPWNPCVVQIRRQPMMLHWWQLFIQAIGYRRNFLGVFGQYVPPSSS